MSKGQKHNGSYRAKQRLRLGIRRELGPGATVLEGFAGEGRIYRGCWAGLRGVCIDIAAAKASAAAKERPTWACYQGDTEKALAAGLGASPFDVVDLDAYGAPWKFVRAYLTSRRRFATTTHLVLTDGYMAQRGRVCDYALFPDKKAVSGMTREAYLEIARDRVNGWLPHGIDAEWVDTVADKAMALHHIVLRAR